MKITRREFAKTTTGAGLLYTLGGRTRGAGAAPFGSETTVRTFHFDLSHYEPFVKHFVHAGGRSYFLQAHTAATRLAARFERPGLVGVPDARLTHFATGVVVSNTHMQRIHVRSNSPIRRHGLSLVAMHIPLAARIRARLARNLGTPPGQTAAASDCLQYDQFADDYLTGRSTAKSIILHHPDLCNLDPDTAAAIETHMDYDQAAAVDNLTISICRQGPAYEHDPAYLDGWAVLVAMNNDDGTPLLDTTGTQIYDYQFSLQTGIDLQPAIEALLASVKQDRSLDGEQYKVIYHGDPVDESALPPASPPILNSDETTSFARSALGGRFAMRNASPKSTGANVTFSTLGYHHNVLFYKQNAAADGRSFSLSIMNLNYVWYGMYIEYLDPDGNALGSGERSTFLNELVASGLDLETDELKFWVHRVRDEKDVAILLIEHDMSVVVRVSERITVLDRGERSPRAARTTSATTTRVIEAYLGKSGAENRGTSRDRNNGGARRREYRGAAQEASRCSRWRHLSSITATSPRFKT